MAGLIAALFASIMIAGCSTSYPVATGVPCVITDGAIRHGYASCVRVCGVWVNGTCSMEEATRTAQSAANVDRIERLCYIEERRTSILFGAYLKRTVHVCGQRIDGN